MTIVEFFDGVSINNMASCIAFKPNKIIFIGENKLMKKQEEAYRRFIDSRGIDVNFEFRSINKNSVEQIITVLTEIVETETECAFDLTGGEDLVLVAMGIVFERYRHSHNIQMHRFNIRTGALYDCDSDGNPPDITRPQITCRENVMLYGGTIVQYNGEKGTYNWVLDEDFKTDLQIMWDLCKCNPNRWNLQIGTISYMVKSCELPAESLRVCAKKTAAERLIRSENRNFIWDADMIKAFYTYGLLTELNDSEDAVSFTFKNEQVEKCLTKEGTLLELFVLFLAESAKGNDGSKKFNDAVTGAFIDWDASIHDMTDEEKDTENEIDVILMNGLVPVFISCKNGNVSESELYKLNTVAEKFGGPFSKKVLVASYFGKSSTEGHKYFVQRAKDMKIKLIENVHELTQEEFAKEIKNILSP